MSEAATDPRDRGDLCPGVLRPWPAADGALVRLRLVGGTLSPAALWGLLDIAEDHGDGRVHLTRRANIQLRALPAVDGVLEAQVVDRISATGLLPVPSHELVRNIMVSPLSGRHGGRRDLYPLAHQLDTGLCADPHLAGLSARFLFVLDDGRGDVITRSSDLALLVLDENLAQLRIGDQWGPVLPVDQAVPALLDHARAFVDARGTGPEAPWHIRELTEPLHPAVAPQAGTAAVLASPAAALPAGPVAAGVNHHLVPDGLLDRALAEQILASGPDGAGPVSLRVTPWRSVLTLS